MKGSFILAFLGLLVGLSSAIEFDLAATTDAAVGRRCLSQWLPKGTHVKVKAKVLPGFPGQTVGMEIHDDSPYSNQYGSQTALDDATFRFDTQTHANVIVCFQNTLDAGQPQDGRALTIQFRMSSGSDAEDYQQLQNEKKLKPMEIELRRLASSLDDVQDQLQYLKTQEGSLRDSNEKMNSRVKSFTFFSISVLVGIAIYEVVYLRRFFQKKKLI